MKAGHLMERLALDVRRWPPDVKGELLIKEGTPDVNRDSSVKDGGRGF